MAEWPKRLMLLVTSSRPLKNRDRGSLKIFMAATLAVPAGRFVGFTKVGHIQTEGNVLGVVGIALMLTGILLRWRPSTL